MFEMNFYLFFCFCFQVRQFIEMVSGSDDSINNSDSSSDNHTDQDMANSNNEVRVI